MKRDVKGEGERGGMMEGRVRGVRDGEEERGRDL